MPIKSNLGMKVRSDPATMSEGKPIRLAIVDDHPMMCSGLTATFEAEDDFEIVGVGGSAETAVEIARSHLPDVMLVDITMPGDGLQAVERISCQFPAVKVIVLTMHADAHYIRKAFIAGASGFLNKGISSTELVSTARSIAHGEFCVPPTVAAGLVSASRNTGDEATAPLVDLNEREVEILMGLSAGKTNKEIALSLGLAEKTIKNYLTNVLRKLHVRSRVEAALIAARRLDLERGPSGS